MKKTAGFAKIKQYIHDGPAQEITVVCLKIDVIKHYLELGLKEKAIAELNSCQTILRRSVEKLQEMAGKCL